MGDPIVNLSALFETVAQVSFTVAGLMLVALAGDSERRKFWFQNKSRAIYALLKLLLLLLPGILSVGGLIAPTPRNLGGVFRRVPSWPLASVFIGIVYLLESMWLSRLRREGDVAFRKVEQVLGETGMTRVTVLLGVLLSFASVFGWFGYRHSQRVLIAQASDLLGVLLSLSVLIGTIDSVLLFRYEADLTAELGTQPEPVVAQEGRGADTEREQSHAASPSPLLLNLLVALAAFLSGVVSVLVFREQKQ